MADPVVLWVAAEAVPWASTGGLGDVVGSLPAVLRRRGWDVRLCLPLHRRLVAARLGPALVERDLPSPGRFRVEVREALDAPGGVPTYFVDCPPLFDRAAIYAEEGEGYEDNPLRFGVLQLAARALAAALDPPPAIVHCHDWHAALLPALLQLQRPLPLEETRTILTVHNLQYQGETDRALLSELGLPRALWHPAWAEHFTHVNPLKAGILSADRVTTVSPTYANEIRTPERGLGLDGPLRERGNDLRAILNGIDDALDPATDPELAAHYSLDDMKGRARCQADLRRELQLPGSPDEPIVAYVGRMTAEKGVDLFAEALPEILGLGARAVALGAGDRAIEAALAQREKEAPDRFRAVLRYDNRLVRRVYAGADILVVPSRVEPCGLVQLYALRYGAVPVVHAVGGLRDTVRDGETGFLFHEPSSAALLGGVRRALELFGQRTKWARLRSEGMRQDWSWAQSAAAYDALYREVLSAPRLRRSMPPLEEAREPPPDWGPELPATLGDAALRLMVKGPSALHVYWEQDAAGPLQLELEERPSGARYLLADRSGVGSEWLAAQPENAYRAVLRRPDGSVAAVSNAVVTPRDRPAPEGEEMPEWLLRAFDAGLFLRDPEGEAWAALFPEPAAAAAQAARTVDPGFVDAPSGSAFVHPPGPGLR